MVVHASDNSPIGPDSLLDGALQEQKFASFTLHLSPTSTSRRIYVSGSLFDSNTTHKTANRSLVASRQCIRTQSQTVVPPPRISARQGGKCPMDDRCQGELGDRWASFPCMAAQARWRHAAEILRLHLSQCPARLKHFPSLN
jgi:hypothetical protein